jgi:3-methylfumaryl-CoA hydratase
MPRRTGAGCRVKVMGCLRAGEPALKQAEVADIVPKSALGDIFVLTMRHTYEQAGKTLRSTKWTHHRPACRLARRPRRPCHQARTDHA